MQQPLAIRSHIGSWYPKSPSARKIHPTNEDLFVGTPELHPTNEDLFVGTPELGHQKFGMMVL
jgi:hypothetical protein